MEGMLRRLNTSRSGNGYANLLASHSPETSEAAAPFAKTPPTTPPAFSDAHNNNGSAFRRPRKGTATSFSGGPQVLVTDTDNDNARPRSTLHDSGHAHGPFSDTSEVRPSMSSSDVSSLSGNERAGYRDSMDAQKRLDKPSAKGLGKRLSMGGFALPKSLKSKEKATRVNATAERKHDKNENRDKKEDSKSQKNSKKADVKAVQQAETVLRLITGGDAEAIKGEKKAKSAQPVSSKQLSQLKSSLTDAKEGPRIIGALKKIPVQEVETATLPHSVDHHLPARGVCLECVEVETSAQRKPISGDFLLNERLGNFAAASDGIPTPGKLLGQLASSSGAFTALAGVTARMIDASGSHEGKTLKPPVDRISIFVYWWGYELVLPPSSIAYLSTVHSVAGTLFTFLQALCVSGGCPELAPFVRYLSTYIDMEWKAIQTQNTGKGVIMAATWVLPVAVVPRPFDF